MAFDAVDCVTKVSSICDAAYKRFPFCLFCHLSMAKTLHFVHCNNQKCLTP